MLHPMRVGRCRQSLNQLFRNRHRPGALARRRLGAVAGALVVLAATMESVRGEPGQTPPSAVVRWLTVADGLPNARVEALARDRHGYVWIGTQGGLVRHEGLVLNVLRRDPDRADSLPGNNVLSLLAAGDGSVWAGISGQGVVRIDGTRVQRHWAPAARGGELRGNYVWSMAEACDGAVWGVYATDGMVRFDPDTGRARHLPAGHGGLPENGFGTQMAVDARCRIWLLRTDGLWQIEPEAPFAVRRHLGAGGTEVPAFLTMALDGEAGAFVGGQNGLLRVDLEPGAAGSAVERAWNIGSTVGALRHAGDGRFWLGLRAGLALFDPASGRQEAFPAARENALGTSMITDILTGAEGEVWIATSGAGVARLPPGWRGFRPFPLADGERRAARVTAAGAHGDAIWAGTADSALVRLNPDTGQTRRFAPSLGANPGEIIDLHAEGDSVWVLRRRILSRQDTGRGNDRALIRIERGAGPQLSFLEPAGRDRFWLADDSGRLRLVDRRGRTLDAWHPAGEGARRLSEASLMDLRAGPAGQWWLLGSRTLYRQDGRGRFVPVLRAADGEFSTLAFQGNDFWLAADSVLERYRIDGGRVARVDRFTAGDGLPAGQIHALVPRGERLWILTSIGLARLEHGDGRFRLFSAREGLRQSQFNPRTLVVLDDGRFAAGTEEGLLVVDPDSIAPASRPPPVHVTAVRAGDRTLALRPDDSFRPRFEWDRNSLEFRFLALSYIDPAQNRYRVRLRGWDKEWQTFTGRTSRLYSGLPAGDYRFEVQAANVDGVWNREGDAVEFEIAPPPWRSAPAWGVYALIGLAVTGLGWRSLRARRRQRESLRQAEAHRQTADRQRALLERLNRSLEPVDLVETLGAAAREMARVEVCHVAFAHPGLPRLTRAFGPADGPVTLARIESAMDSEHDGTVLVLGEARQPLALVWMPGLDAGRRAPVQARLELFAQAAGQVLENARLFAEVRTLAREAREASAAKSEFLATMSHEIRTPLHGMLGMMELLNRDGLDAEFVETVRTMRASGRQLERILNDILDLSRIEAGRVELEAQPFELPSMLERVVELHASNAEAGGLALRLRIAADLPVVAVGDADRIAQIAGNLLSNAIKFTAEGSVELSAWMARDGRLCLAVADTGPGIDAAVQRELFEPFTQLDAGSTRRHSGTGLGLAICRRLVEAMDGEIGLASDPGRGSRFTARLPLAGLVRQAPFRLELLRGLRLATAVPAPDRRVVARLARRWSIGLARSDESPAACDVAIYRADRIGVGALEDLRRAGVACWHLGEPGAGEDAATARLRRPLTESRLIGALADLVLSRSG